MGLIGGMCVCAYWVLGGRGCEEERVYCFSSYDAGMRRTAERRGDTTSTTSSAWEDRYDCSFLEREYKCKRRRL